MDTKLCKQRINRADLDAGAAAPIAQLCSIYVILPVGHQKREGREPPQNLRACLRAGETLQQLLQHETGGENDMPTLKRADQGTHFRQRGWRISSKCERPDACIDKETQLRARSFL